MQHDLLCEFEEYSTVCSLWIILKDKLGGSLPTKFKGLTIIFENYRKRSRYFHG